MGRKRKSERIPENLLLLPWWFGPLIAVMAYFSSIWFGIFVSSLNSPLAHLGDMIGGLAPLVAIVVLFLWGVTLLAKKKRCRLLDSRDGIDSIQSVSWRDFERLIGEALRRQGYTVTETGGEGADGGIDLIAHRGNETMLVQCKRWKSYSVGVKVVREMFGIMTAASATSVLIVSSGQFTKDAQSFAEGKPIRLINGEQLVTFLASVKKLGSDDTSAEAIQSVSPAAPPDLNQAPACPKCGSPMVERKSKKGQNVGQKFLGCSLFPRCNGTRKLP